MSDEHASAQPQEPDSSLLRAPEQLDPADDARIRELLGALPPVVMPAAVADRIGAAIRTESLARVERTAAAHSAGAGDEVGAARSRRNPGARRYVAIASAAAAIAVAGVVGLTVAGQSGGAGTSPPVTAAAVSSGTHYESASLADQVTIQLSSAPASPVASIPATSQSPSPAATAPARSRMPISGTFAATREGIADCLRGLARSQNPILVDVATYADVPAAVLALPDEADRSMVDVFVVRVSCSSADPHMLSHVRIPSP